MPQSVNPNSTAAEAMSPRGAARPKLLIAVIVILSFDLIRTAFHLVARVSAGILADGSAFFLVWLPLAHALLLLPAVIGLWRLASWGGWAALALIALRAGQAIWFSSSYWNHPGLGTRAPMELVNAGFALAIGAYLLLLLNRGVLSK